jgi:hypothetical protein
VNILAKVHCSAIQFLHFFPFLLLCVYLVSSDAHWGYDNNNNGLFVTHSAGVSSMKMTSLFLGIDDVFFYKLSSLWIDGFLFHWVFGNCVTWGKLYGTGW